MSQEGELPITGGELTVLARVGAAVRRIFRQPQPAAVLRYRETMRQQIRKNLAWPERDEAPEVVVVRLAKKDEYPSVDALRFGLFRSSPWFKLEVKRLHDRGLEVYLRIEHVSIRRGKARTAPPAEPTPPNALKVWVVGRIPYERIAHIDWEPDPVYSAPRFYVEYGWRGPYREVVLYEQARGAFRMRARDGGLLELPDVDYQGEAGNPWRWLTSTLRRLKAAYVLRREDRRATHELWK